MTSTQAVLVGIDTYPTMNKTVSGPCSGALKVARWLLTLGDPGLRIDLFLSPQAVHAADIADLQTDPRIALHDARSATLQDFLIDALARTHRAERLFIYWSGHGLTSQRSDHRYLYPSDYSALQDNGFNATNYLRRLRTEPYEGFRSQLFLADVCGVYRNPLRETTEDHSQGKVPQLAYFATRDGDFTTTSPQGGAFTLALLDVLTQIGSAWDQFDQLSARIVTAIPSAALKSCSLAGWLDQNVIPIAGAIPVVSAGAGDAPPLPAYHRDALKLLAKCDGEALYRPHYERTARNWLFPPCAPTLRDAVAELATMRDSELDDGPPRALLQFMMRLGELAVLAAPIEQWLTRHAAGLQPSCAQLRRLFEQERARLVLLIEVQNNAGGSISHFQAYLCHQDGRFVPNRRFDPCPVQGWDDLVLQLQTLFHQLAPDGMLDNLCIHFLVDPPLFDAPFHEIPVAPGMDEIGKLTAVTLKYKSRMRLTGRVRDKWLHCAEVLNHAAPEVLRWRQVQAAPAELPGDPGLFFAAFSLPSRERDTSAALRKRELQDLLRLGAPCLFIPLADPDGADFAKLGEHLNAHYRPAADMYRIADILQDERLRRKRLALQASLLLDDPRCNPFINCQGASDA